jgi:serine/threonine protein kinase
VISTTIHIAGLPKEAQQALGQFPEFVISSFNDSGANGFVMIGRHQVLNKDVAIKIYYHEKGQIDQEPALVSRVLHDNVLKVYDARKLDDTCSYYMMPVANEGDLAGFLEKYFISLHQAHKLLCQLLSGLSALHAPEIALVHRDLKPENLLIHDDVLSIADFGSVRRLGDDGKAPASRHSILYRPAEAFGDNAFFDSSSDVYQAGMVGYLLFGGKLSNDLLEYLTEKDLSGLAKVRETGGQFEESRFVDSCLERLIKKNILLDWNSLPCYVPGSIVKILKKATKPHGQRYPSVSEFLAALARVKKNLPDWIDTTNGPMLCNWNKLDYLISKKNDIYCIKKGRTGGNALRNDNSFLSGEFLQVFENLKRKLCLP